MFFAQEVIRTAPKVGLFDDLAVGNLLMVFCYGIKTLQKLYPTFRQQGSNGKKSKITQAIRQS